MWKKRFESQLATAKELFDSGDFQGSVNALAQLVTNRKRPPIQALDRRAAAYIGLQDLPAALRDGRKAIRLYSKDVEGYARTVQVLCLMHNQEAASRMCREGLKRIPKDSVGHKTLSDLRNQVIAVDPSLHAMDPLGFFPLEIVEMVLQYLDFREIVLLISVSKTWKRAIESIPRLWCNLDLSEARRQVKPKFIQSCIRRSDGALTHATLINVQRLCSEKSFHSLLDQCLLQSLRFQSPRCQGELPQQILHDIANISSLKTLVLEIPYIINMNDVALILGTSKSLEVVEFHAVILWQSRINWPPCPRLKAIVLNQSRSFEPYYPPAMDNDLCRAAPNLQKIELCNWLHVQRFTLGYKKLSKLEMLSLSGSSFYAFPPLPRSLKTLTIEVRRNLRLLGQDVIDTPLPNLQAISISSWPSGDNLLQVFLSPSRGKLRVFGMTSAGTRYADFHRVLTDGLLEQVEVLFLGCVLEEQDVEDIAAYMPALYEMHVSYGMVTRSGIKALAGKRGTPLRKLVGYVGDFEGDAVEYAQTHGVRIIMRNDAPASTKGRRRAVCCSRNPVEDGMLAAFKATLDDLNLVSRL